MNDIIVLLEYYHADASTVGVTRKKLSVIFLT